MAVIQSNRKKKVAVVSLLTFLILSVSVLCILALNNTSLFSRPAESSGVSSTKQLDENGNALDGSVKQKSQEAILEELKEKQITVTDQLGSHIYFPSGKSGTEGDWVVENVKANTVTIQCEVFLGDKMIAKSVPIRPNQHIETIILSEDVAAGEYDVIAYVNYYNPDSGEYLAKAGFKIKLTVQSIQ